MPLREHLARHGRLELERGELLRELEASGLSGRGGAGFPVARKVRAVAERRGRPVVVVNAAEGEPTSGKDKLLLRHLPHLVIDGAVALARELGAREAIIVHSAAARHAGDALRAAIEDRSARRFDGGCKIEAVELPAGFVRGQEAAIVQYLNGGPALPTVMPPRPFESGVDGRPTLIQNAETAAHIALIGRYGAGWFRELGTPAEPGSALFTVSGAIGRPGVYEAEIGVRLKDLVATAGGVTGTPRAFLVGGYACAWVGAADAASLTLDEASLRALGGSLGVGAVTVLPAGACGVCETARVARFLADESAGQCGPCVHGLDAVAAALEHPRPDRARIERWLGHVARPRCLPPPRRDSAVRCFRAEGLRRRPARTRFRALRARPQARAADEEAVSDSLRVDPIVCEGHGLCAELFPERIQLDDWGYPIIDSEPIPRALAGHARRAVAACPVLALRLVTAKERATAA